jgi:hypothetical protein
MLLMGILIYTAVAAIDPLLFVPAVLIGWFCKRRVAIAMALIGTGLVRYYLGYFLTAFSHFPREQPDTLVLLFTSRIIAALIIGFVTYWIAQRRRRANPSAQPD